MQNESEQRPIFLNLIFERDANGKYTNNALLYQDILEYFFETINNSGTKNNGTYGSPDGFFFNDLAGWLVTKKNAEFVSYYTDFNSRVSKQNRINLLRIYALLNRFNTSLIKSAIARCTKSWYRFYK
jgi:hypothetical protein